MNPKFNRVLIRPHLRPERLVRGPQDPTDRLCPVRNEHPTQEGESLLMLGWIPLHDFVSSTSEPFDRLTQSTSDWWSRGDDTVIPEYG